VIFFCFVSKRIAGHLQHGWTLHIDPKHNEWKLKK